MTVLALAMATGPAQSAPAVNHDRIISAVPGQTPAVNDGEVDNVAQIGNTLVVGGTFSSVTPVGGAATTRHYVFAFDIGTGKLVTGFAPTLNGPVNEVIPGPTTGTVYLGGSFSTVNGAAQSHVTLLNASTGAVVSGFRAASTNGAVNAMVLRNNRLFVGGNFTTAGGVAHGGLTSLKPTSGALDPYTSNQVAQRHNDSGQGAQGAIGVRDLDVTADGTKLVAIGNFKRVDGQSRDQVAVLDLGPSSSTVSPDWRTTRYSPYCFNFAFDTYVRGVSFSPDGSYFVVAATGGQNAGTLCDTAARFETRATGQDVQPTWVDYTGGDTLWSVTVTEKAVYVGGHQRWLNNSLASDRAGAGSVPRPGLAALDVNTGLPLKWNPGRNPRGAAVYALYATPTGLWLGSDTEYIGNHQYRRPRLAFFPLASGSPEASDTVGAPPGNVYLGGNQNPPTATSNDLRRASLTTTGAGAAGTIDAGGVSWSGLRGSFYAGGKLYYGKSDNTFDSRTFTGTTFGPEVRIDPYHDPVWDGVDTGSNNTFDGVPPALYGQLSTVNGMAYANGRLYYTRGTDTNLHWRWFNADSGIIGTDEFTANGGRSWAGTGGMFAAGGKLYFVSKTNGNLSSVTLTPTGPTGTPAVVNGPSTGGNDWRTRALFFVSGNTTPPNSPPTASFSSFCSGLSCHFDANNSKDTDGTISSYAWNFGDTASGSGISVDHPFGSAGTYNVRLTVTDNGGATNTSTVPVTVPQGTGGGVSFAARSTAAGNVKAPSLTVPTQVQVGDTLLLTANLSNATSVSAPSGWTLVGDQSATSLRGLVWTKVATAADAGSTVAVTMDAIHKATLALTAYRGVDTAAVSATAATDANTATHTTPAVASVPTGAWVVSVWSDKSANTKWTTPGGTALRAEAYTTASGSVTQAVADSGAGLSGPVNGQTATSTATSARGVHWSIVLPPQ